VKDLRDKYLFSFARFLHIPPRDVDALRYMDFIQLVLGLQELLEGS
jgi:hypothetical protein